MGTTFHSKFGNHLTPVWPDRDNFIRVNEENIAPEMRNQFVKRPYGYDYRDYFEEPNWCGTGRSSMRDFRGFSGISGIGGIGGMQLKTPYDVLSVNSVRKEKFFKNFQIFKNCQNCQEFSKKHQNNRQR